MTLGDLALEVADAGFARVVIDDLVDAPCPVMSSCSVVRPCSSSCFGTRCCARDRELLVARVAGDLEDLHAVAERRRDRVGDVRGGDEHHLREVERDLEVVVGERVVLLGVEHLEQRRRGVAAEVGADLVDLVEHEDRVDRARLLHALDDPAGERADVRAAVTADLRLVAHAAERDAVRTCGRARARSTAPSDVLPTPGGPMRQRIGPFLSCFSLRTARYSRMRFFTFSRP